MAQARPLKEDDEQCDKGNGFFVLNHTHRCSKCSKFWTHDDGRCDTPAEIVCCECWNKSLRQP